MSLTREYFTAPLYSSPAPNGIANTLTTLEDSRCLHSRTLPHERKPYLVPHRSAAAAVRKKYLPAAVLRIATHKTLDTITSTALRRLTRVHMVPCRARPAPHTEAHGTSRAQWRSPAPGCSPASPPPLSPPPPSPPPPSPPPSPPPPLPCATARLSDVSDQSRTQRS